VRLSARTVTFSRQAVDANSELEEQLGLLLVVQFSDDAEVVDAHGS
jgi:hypothetical protein